MASAASTFYSSGSESCGQVLLVELYPFPLGRPLNPNPHSLHGTLAAHPVQRRAPLPQRLLQ